jgi:hypothetical protein
MVKNKNEELVKVTPNQLTRDNYFNYLQHNLDDYSEMEFTPQEASKLTNHIKRLSTGASAMTPLVCHGPQCPFASRCPLQQMGKAPIGKQCLIEVQLMKDFIIRAMMEYDVDPNSFTEVAYINELAEIEVLLMRLNMSISRPENAELVIDQIVAIGQDGTPVIQKQVSPYQEQKEKLLARRSRVIKLMVGDRQEKYKKEAALKVKLDKDPSSKMAIMRGKLEALSSKLDQLSSEDPEESKERSVTPQDLIDNE